MEYSLYYCKFFPNGIDLKRYLVNYFTAGGAATMYYIFVYIQFVLLTPYLGKLLKKKCWYLGFMITPIFLIIKYYCLMNGIVSNNYISKIWSVCCLSWLTFYYLGLYLKNSYNNKKFSYKVIVPLYLLSIIVQIVEGYYWFNFGDVNCGTQLKISSLFTSTMFILFAYNYINNANYKGDSKILQLIGNYSFGIYISHCMVIGLLSNFISDYKLIPFIINSSIVLFITLLCVLIGKKILGDKVSKYFGLY